MSPPSLWYRFLQRKSNGKKSHKGVYHKHTHAPTFDSATFLPFLSLLTDRLAAVGRASVQRKAFKRLFVSPTLLPLGGLPLLTRLLCSFALQILLRILPCHTFCFDIFFSSYFYLLEFVFNFPCNACKTARP